MIDIAALTAETILEDTTLNEVFEQDDEIAKARLLINLESRAKTLGVKTEFTMLVQAYKKARKKENRIQPVQTVEIGMIDSNGKYPEMRCGAWTVTDFGITSTNAIGLPIMACYHPIIITEILKNIQTGREKATIAYKKRGKWTEIIIDKSVITSASKIVSLSEYGVSVTSEIARGLVKFLADLENYNLDVIPEKISTSKLGWINNKFMPYTQKDMIFDGESRYSEAFKSIGKSGSSVAWYELIKNIRKSGRFETNLYLISSLASVLVEPLNALPFIVNLYGETGKGKTVALMLAASIWGNPGESGIVSDAKATVVALEMRLDFLNNLPLLVDDLAQVKTKYDGDFTNLIYMLCSGRGRDRSNQNLGLNKSTTWKNSVLTNAEHALATENMQGGAINRIIDVELSGNLFENGNETVTKLKENYGFLGQDFIEIIEELGTDKIREIQQTFMSELSHMTAEKKVEGKQLIPMSLILTADKISSDYIFKDDIYLDINRCADLLKGKNEISEDERAYEYILSDLDIHTNCFRPDERGNYKNECWGVIENGFAFIQTNVFDLMCSRGNFNRKSFLTWASNKGLLVTEKGRTTKTKRMNGANGRCVCLKLPKETSDFVVITKQEQEELPFM